MSTETGHDTYMDFQAKARALCPGGCEYGPTVTTLDCGDGPAFAQIKTCTNECANCIRRTLQESAAQPQNAVSPTIAAFEASRRAVGEPAIILTQYHVVEPAEKAYQSASDAAA
jgi:hypothetical protein